MENTVKIHVYFESLNSYLEILNSYFESLNSYFESLNSYFESLNSYFESLNSLAIHESLIKVNIVHKVLAGKKSGLRRQLISLTSIVGLNSWKYSSISISTEVKSLYQTTAYDRIKPRSLNRDVL